MNKQTNRHRCEITLCDVTTTKLCFSLGNLTTRLL